MSSSITLGASQYTLIPLPAAPGMAQIEVSMVDAVAVQPSPFVPSQVQTLSWPGADAWGLTITLPKMSRWTASPWRGFMAELRGMQNVFQLGDPLCTTPLGVAGGAPVCATTTGLNLTSATQLATEGWTPSVFGQLLSGDYLQIGLRLYQVCENVNSDSGGNATISIWPSLRESPSLGTPIVLVNTVGVFRLAQNQRIWHSDYTGLVQMSFKCVEVR